MITLCWAAKGGAGTTVVTSTLALESERPAVLVDLGGDIPTMLGMEASDRPGLGEWLDADGSPQQLDDLLIDIDDTTAILPFRAALDQRPISASSARWHAFISWLETREQSTHGDIWIDGGTGTPPGVVARGSSQQWLVTRPCYLALQKASCSSIRPSGVVVVDEPGRALRQRDIERSTGAPVVARVPFDPRIAQAVDAGLLLTRPPHAIRRRLRSVAV